MKTIKRLENGKPACVPSEARPADHNKTPNEAGAARKTVALEAYLIYEHQGRPQGRDVQHWLEAEARVLST